MSLGPAGWLDKLTLELEQAWTLRGRKRRDRMAFLAEVHLAVLIGTAKAVERKFPGAIEEAWRS